ncbi:MAG: extracellular solute-binding protein [Alcanivorax sp.]|nr:extracellular solute-binding protein [Alcanivorax sp.]
MRTFLRAQTEHFTDDALTVYSAGPGGLIRALADAYTRDTGLPVNVFQATTGKVLARLEAESASPAADLFISASWDTGRALQARGWLAPMTAPRAMALPAQFRTATCAAQGISALGIIWHRDCPAPAPRDWTDLADPVYADLITTPDPALSGAAVDLLLGLQHTLGDRAWVLFDALRRNRMAVTGANAQALASVLRGERGLVFGAVDYMAHDSISQGAPVRFIMPDSGTVIAPRAMMVLNSSQRKAQAFAFVDHVLSDAGQAAVTDAGLIPARLDVATARGRSLRDVTLLQLAQAHESARLAARTRFADLFAG